MIRLSVLFSAVCILILIWHESGENPALFCYRIESARNRAFVLAPVSVAARTPMTQRTNTACSTRSSTFSVRSIIPRD